MTPAEELDSILARLCLYREARGESMAAKAGVLAVIRNRVADPRGRWPKTIAGVVTQPFQFSSFNALDPNVTVWPKAAIGSIANSGVANWQAWIDCCDVWSTPLIADPTNGAQFYHDSSIAPPAEAWLGKGKTAADLEAFKTCEIGRLKFYKIP